MSLYFLVDHQELNQSKTISLDHLIQKVNEGASRGPSMKLGDVAIKKRNGLPAGDYNLVYAVDGKEYVLLAIERKRHSDLARSYTELSIRYPTFSRTDTQRKDLLSSGIPNLVYMVEVYKHSDRGWYDNARLSLDLRIIDTSSTDDSIRKLIDMYKQWETTICDGNFDRSLYPTFGEVKENVKEGKGQLKAESDLRRAKQSSCGLKKCKCAKAKDPQTCKRCQMPLQKGDCIVKEDTWIHASCSTKKTATLCVASKATNAPTKAASVSPPWSRYKGNLPVPVYRTMEARSLVDAKDPSYAMSMQGDDKDYQAALIASIGTARQENKARRLGKRRAQRKKCPPGPQNEMLSRKPKNVRRDNIHVIDLT